MTHCQKLAKDNFFIKRHCQISSPLNHHSLLLFLPDSPPSARNHGRCRRSNTQHTPLPNPSSSIGDALPCRRRRGGCRFGHNRPQPSNWSCKPCSPRSLSTKTMADRRRSTTHHPQNPPSSTGEAFPCQGCRGRCRFGHNRRHIHRIGVASWVHLPNFAQNVKLCGWKEGCWSCRRFGCIG